MADVIAWAKIKDAKDAVLEALTNVQSGLSGTLSTMSSTLNAVKTQATNAASYANTAKSNSASILASDLVKNSSAIKSVQRGIYTGQNGTVTISVVDTSKTMVVTNPAAHFYGSSAGNVAHRVSLTNSTTLTFEVYTTARGNSATTPWQVIEFY